MGAYHGMLPIMVRAHGKITIASANILQAHSKQSGIPGGKPGRNAITWYQIYT
ncbi:hypothetical protein ThrDRAFT_02719 [Frankia casuarinae]|nr:hypothetical protein CcI6DRAFT_03393 [Frankia sp. CcI6]EYT91596.1 hypothetical protein ThrDRAFT_02719 [Frankia casuarinae]KDA41180.1 hypothetical protein BMG523Draft_04012 [Frankia sp. BMG5.23]OAA22665.1 hypothetical protein AAY23_106115 [Frankia casuarinae]